MEEKKYKVYYLIDPRDELVKYVGITSQYGNNRFHCHANLHKTILKYKRNLNVKDAWIRSLSDKDLIPAVEIVFDNLTEQEACEVEIELINLFGRQDLGQGQLKNGTNGGGGTKGFVASKEFRERQSKRMEGYVTSNETKAKISKSKKGQVSWCKGKTGIFSDEALSKIQKNQPQRKSIEVFKNNVSVGVYVTINEACRQLNLVRTSVSSTLSGRNKSHKGYTFKVVEE
jgi:hypothetical protein